MLSEELAEIETLATIATHIKGLPQPTSANDAEPITFVTKVVVGESRGIVGMGEYLEQVRSDGQQDS